MTNALYCGECTQVMKEYIPDNSIDLTVTSPPYDTLRTYNGYHFPFEDIAKELFRVTKQGGVVVWIVGDQTKDGTESGTSFRQALYFKEIGFNLWDTMIYHRNSPFPPNVRYYQEFEYMFVLSKGKVKTFNPLYQDKNGHKHTLRHTERQKNGSLQPLSKNAGMRLLKANETTQRVMSNIWRISSGSGHSTLWKDAHKHPAIFPEKLAEMHILSWSNENDMVFDPMCGSGTTLAMAVKNNRKFTGIDISQEYVDLAHQRVAQWHIPITLF